MNSAYAQWRRSENTVGADWTLWVRVPPFGGVGPWEWAPLLWVSFEYYSLGSARRYWRAVLEADGPCPRAVADGRTRLDAARGAVWDRIEYRRAHGMSTRGLERVAERLEG